jgi:hypothetical protein
MLTFETVRDIGTGLYAMAYTIYLPFATATGAVAGEIDAQRWNFCKDDFMQKVREANPANEIIDTVVKASPGLLVLTKDDAFEKAKELGLSKLVTVMINGVGLKTCFDLGVFSLAVDATASVYDVATKEKLFSENYTPRSSQCLKADSYCSEKGTTFTQKEINRLAVEIAGHIRSLIENRL